MLYYQGYTISFQEVPDEISLVLLIADCPYRCPGCHSPNLQKPEGKDLEQILPSLIEKYEKIVTCVCFMGEGRDRDALIRCARLATDYKLKTALYTGSDCVLLSDYNRDFNYLKIGSYNKNLGGLDCRTTNQRMFRFTRSETGPVPVEDITVRFWDRKNW